MIYLLARAVPRVNQSASDSPRKDYFEEFFKKLPLEKADAFVSFWLERGLRSLKVTVLKLDNLLTKHLQKLRPLSNGPSGKPNLFDGSVKPNSSSESSQGIGKKDENLQ